METWQKYILGAAGILIALGVIWSRFLKPTLDFYVTAKQLVPLLKKMNESALNGATVVALLPAKTNTNWWHDYCMKHEIRFLRGRPKFNGAKHGLPFPLAVVVFRPV